MRDTVVDKREKQLDPLGGQAVIEGVMMRSKTSYAVVVRRKDGSIAYKKAPLPEWVRGGLMKIPIVRGTVALFHSLKVGLDALTFSSNVAMRDEGEKELKGSSYGFVIVVSIIFGLAFFVGLPYLFTYLIQRFTGFAKGQFTFNVIDGIFRIAMVLGYIWVISLSKEIRRVFEYHGAEHKTIAAYESGGDIDIESTIGKSRFHPRCGTSFLIVILLLLIIVHTVVFSLTGPISIALNILIRVLLIPVIAGLAYEIIKLASRYPDNILVKVLTYPGLFTQLITTREPDRGQLEVAGESIKILLNENIKERDDLILEEQEE
ncbi:MAG: DUF1385 domain-containing protein [Candidatus Coatesbacteria bacterium]|nr:MAG: DUF1385 domain-containing protein [Candidatus Coatesbacteria bacterium]